MLNRKIFFIRERVGLIKLADTYDILDPETQETIGIAQEKPSVLVHILRLLVSKQMLPTKIFVYEGANAEDATKMIFSIQRGITLLRAKVNIVDGNGRVVGWLQSKLFSLGGAFRIFDVSGQEVAFVKGDWKGWSFRLLDKAGNQLGSVTKKWGGIGRELLTSADSYVIALDHEPVPATALLLLAAGLAVDTVYKEKR
ncbi:MAG: oxidoreductase [Lentisphaerae bacterium]|nr:oxidoreductase [Lentisphaerota bacterium]